MVLLGLDRSDRGCGGNPESGPFSKNAKETEERPSSERRTAQRRLSKQS